MPKEEFLKVTNEDTIEKLKSNLEIKNRHRKSRVELVKDVQKTVTTAKKKEIKI